jgi:hypothetical protein
MTHTEPCPLRLADDRGHLFVLVPCRSADRLHEHLRRRGVRTTVRWVPWEEHARIDLPPGADAAEAQRALDSFCCGGHTDMRGWPPSASGAAAPLRFANA